MGHKLRGVGSRHPCLCGRYYVYPVGVRFLPSFTKATLIYCIRYNHNHLDGALISPSDPRSSKFLVSHQGITRLLFLKCAKLETDLEQSSNGNLGFQQRKGLLPFEILNEVSFR